MSESPPEDISLDYDVIVIGAGISGLIAARELKRKAPELRVHVLEAKDRVGGRTLTVPIKAPQGKTEMFDLGGQWVGRTQQNILEVINELDLETYEQYDKGFKWAQMGQSKPRKFDTSLPSYSIRQFSFFEVIDQLFTMIGVEQLTRKVNMLDIFSSKEVTQMDDMSVSQYVREKCWTRASEDAIGIISKSVFGVNSNRVNMLYNLVLGKSAGVYTNLLEHIGDGAQAMKIKGGAQQISERLADEVGPSNISMSSAVSGIGIDESTSTTTVYLYDTEDSDRNNAAMNCSRVIMAIPPSQCSKVDFAPQLPNLKRQLFDNIQTGHYIKFIITYETAFWREEGMSGEIISSGRTAKEEEVLPIIVCYDATSPNGCPAIVGFMNEEFADFSKADRCNLVTKDLMRFLGEKAMNEFVDYEDKIWALEPFNGGCPGDFYPPGCMNAYTTIRDPFHSVHFAATETSRVWIGYMDGAVESGKRAANEVLHCMEKHTKVSYTCLKGTVFDSEYTTPRAPCHRYDERRSPWLRRIFFFTILSFGVYVYSKKYSLSYTAKTVKPMENAVIRFFTGIRWPT